MLLDFRCAEGVFAEALAMPLRIAGSDNPLSVHSLTAGEQNWYERLATAQRRQAWLLGRTALKELLQQMGEEDDTAPLSFPNPRYSLTHCDAYAVAVGAPSGSLGGIGIDLELLRFPHPEATRFFLTSNESSWVEGLAGGRKKRELQRLWTVKEALFKSDPDNHGRTLTDYRIQDPEAVFGIAFSETDGQVMEYASVRFLEGTLSVAVRLSQEVFGCLKS